jgi:hypothetical protein
MLFIVSYYRGGLDTFIVPLLSNGTYQVMKYNP